MTNRYSLNNQELNLENYPFQKKLPWDFSEQVQLLRLQLPLKFLITQISSVIWLEELALTVFQMLQETLILIILELFTSSDQVLMIQHF